MIKGLTKQEVEERIEKGHVNYNAEPKTKSEKTIIKEHIFTYFNILNFCLALAIIIASVIWGNLFSGLKNCLFMGVVFINAIISIIQEIISKRIIDKLTLIASKKVKVLREEEESVNTEEIVLDDILILKIGDQVPCDAVILEGQLEVSEEFITGESDPLEKSTNQELLSGSFVVSGSCYAKVIHVGLDNYVSKISTEAKHKKKIKSVIKDSFDSIVKIISIFIIPIGIILFLTQLQANNFIYVDALYKTVAALIGMIPEGLILLTSSVMAVSVIRLSRYNVLVQELYCIETLSRVDVICLDKTGTLTEAEMEVIKFIPYKTDESEVEKVMREYTSVMNADNETMIALKKYFKGETTWQNKDVKPFSSSKKYSSIKFDNNITYYLGALEFIMEDISPYEKIIKKNETYRMITIASEEKKEKKVIGFIFLENKVRQEAKETLDYFQEQKVQIKIISGDSLNTVLNITDKVGVTNLKGIDVSKLNDEELKKIVEEYNVFARVNPFQKKIIINALQHNNHTVAMTGDGVNDVLALKESDFAISFKEATAPARNVSQIILLDGNFASLPKVVAEGRRTINNLERSSSLLLVKTIFTILLALFSVLIAERYFFVPIQLTLINAFTIGIPSFLLALEPNHERVEGNFLLRIISKSLPTALIVVFNVMIVVAFQYTFNLPFELTSTLAVFLTGTTGFIFLYRTCQPFNIQRAILYSLLFLGFGYSILYQFGFFELTQINNSIVLIFFVLSVCSIYFYDKFNKISCWLFHKFDKTIKEKNIIFK